MPNEFQPSPQEKSTSLTGLGSYYSTYDLMGAAPELLAAALSLHAGAPELLAAVCLFASSWLFLSSTLSARHSGGKNFHSTPTSACSKRDVVVSLERLPTIAP